MADFNKDLRDLKAYLEMQERREEQKEQRVKNALQREREAAERERERINRVKAQEARRAALAACGWTSPPEFMIQGRGEEMQGGLPSLGKNQ